MLVCLHGFTETDLNWREVFDPTGLDVAYPLLPGHGWSPCPPETDLASTATALAERYRSAGPVDLLGYSMGGRIALRWALDHPATIRRLILVSTRAGIEDAARRADRAAREEGLAELLEEDGISTFVASWENHRVLRPYRPYSEAFQEQLRSQRLNQDAGCLAAALRALGQGSMAPLWDRLPKLAMPCLLVGGEADASFRDDLERMARTMPQATLQLVPACAHAVHREAPAALLRHVLHFLVD